MKALKVAYLNAQFWLLFFLLSAVAIPVFSVGVAAQALFLSRRRAMRRFRRAISWYGKLIIRIAPFPLVRVRYEDTCPVDVPGPHVYVCNHRSASDPFLMACLPDECVQVVNDWPFRLPVLGAFARWAGYLSVREMPFEEFLARAGKLLDEGVSLIAFPEGTRAAGREMGPFHGAVFRLALSRKAPIVPLCISGSEHNPHRGSLRLHPGSIRVRKLKALAWETYRDWGPFRLKTSVRRMIERELAEMEGAGA